jgi:hypothetical protein
MCDADLGWDRPHAINEQKQGKVSPSPQECVGTYKDRAYVGKANKIMVPTVKPKDTSAVSLKATVGGKDGGRRAAYP